MRELCKKIAYLRPATLPTVKQKPLFDSQNLKGRLVEIYSRHAPAALTTAFNLISQVQSRGEPVAWICTQDNTFYPPDALENGIDLAALAVVHLGDPREIPKASDKLIRSGGFGLVVMDLFADQKPFRTKHNGKAVTLPTTAQSRLAGLARKHNAVALILNPGLRETPLAPLASLRGQTRRRLYPESLVEITVVKDKCNPNQWTHKVVCRGTTGLR